MLALSQRCAVLVGEASTTSTRPWLTLHRLAEGLQEPTMFTQATNAAPLLVAGLHDPATPLFGAKALERTFRQARLVTWPGWGHGALESGDCDAIVAAYLVDGTLPSQGDRCPVVAS